MEKFNEAVIAVEKITCPTGRTRRKGWSSGYNLITLRELYCQEKSYSTTHVFNSNRSKCFKDVITFLEYHGIPHKVEQVDRQWEGTRVFKQWDIQLILPQKPESQVLA